LDSIPLSKPLVGSNPSLVYQVFDSVCEFSSTSSL